VEKESDVMSHPALHGERLLLDRPGFERLTMVTIEDDEWKDFEKIIGLPISGEIRDRIKFHLDVYSLAGSAYSPDNTALVTEVLPALDRWMRAGNSLLEKLKAEKKDIQSRDTYVEFLDPARIATLSRDLPAQLLLFSVQSALAAGEIVKHEIENENRNLPIENDLWSAWVCLTARILDRAGLTISGASTDKSTHESPFIRGIVKLQSFLPKECRHFNGYESVRTATQQSLRRMGGMKDELLLQVLIWGLQSPECAGYPGNLREGSKDRFVAFEARVKDMQDIFASRNRKFSLEPYSVYPHLRPSSEP
jgi:hypothetical protein